MAYEKTFDWDKSVICFDERGRAIKEPYDRNLTKIEFQAMLIERVLDY